MALWEVTEMIRRDRPTVARINQEFRLRIYPRLKALEGAGALGGSGQE